jgi:hypothetical protein
MPQVDVVWVSGVFQNVGCQYIDDVVTFTLDLLHVKSTLLVTSILFYSYGRRQPRLITHD